MGAAEGEKEQCSAKRSIVEISTIADLKIIDFYNSENNFYNRPKMTFTSGKRGCKHFQLLGALKLALQRGNCDSDTTSFPPVMTAIVESV